MIFVCHIPLLKIVTRLKSKNELRRVSKLGVNFSEELRGAQSQQFKGERELVMSRRIGWNKDFWIGY